MDKCECGGKLLVYKTRINFAQKVRVRHMKCEKCGKIPATKFVIPIQYAPPRTDSRTISSP